MKFGSPDCSDSSVSSLEAIGEMKHSADFCSLCMALLGSRNGVTVKAISFRGQVFGSRGSAASLA
jgi:hypothetical protein